MFNIKYIDFKRLNEYIDLYFSDKISKWQRLAIKIDFMYSVIRDGAGMNDYFEYEFYKKRHNERQTFIVRRKRKLIADKFNNKRKIVDFSDKSKFNRLFKKFVKRDWIDLDTSTIILTIITSYSTPRL